ncbi:MAG: hypothetical protein QM767_10940 [Anaeromyxobacter sp.]
MSPLILLRCALLAAGQAGPAAHADPAPPAAADLTPEAAERLALRAIAIIAADEPEVRRVQEAAARQFDRSAPDPRDVPGRVRAAALLPRVTAEYRHDEQSYRTVGLQGSGEVDYQHLAPGTTWMVRATWDLGALVAPSGELAAAAAAQLRARRRAEAVLRATALHHQRLRLRVELLLAPPGDPVARARAELEVARLGAELDVLTGGSSAGEAGP